MRSPINHPPDPIVEEVRRVRAKLWEAFGDDPERVFEHLRKRAEEHPERIIGPEEFLRRFGTSEQRNPLPEPAGGEAPRSS